MIFPKGFSPFTTDSYIEKGHLFEDPDSFFHHLDEVEKRPKFTESYVLQSEIALETPKAAVGKIAAAKAVAQN
jgi:hypothetical protein